MRHRPNSDLCPDGIHPATIRDAEERVSQNGNEMIELKLEVYPSGSETSYPVTDYVVDLPKMQYKLRHLCESAHVDYNAEVWHVNDFIGKDVRVEIVTNESTKYGKQAGVKDYLPRSGNGPTATNVEREPIDADIPF